MWHKSLTLHDDELHDKETAGQCYGRQGGMQAGRKPFKLCSKGKQEKLKQES